MTPFDYTPFYCEENVLRLCGRREFSTGDALAVLISNAPRRVFMRQQRSGAPPEGSVCWDYHVIGIWRGTTGWEVWDFESRLGFRSPAPRYLAASFVEEAPARPLLRVLAAEVYARELRSDRAHMRRSDGSWTAAPPPWPACDSPGGIPLWSLLDMERAAPGEVLSLDECRRRFAAP